MYPVRRLYFETNIAHAGFVSAHPSTMPNFLTASHFPQCFDALQMPICFGAFYLTFSRVSNAIFTFASLFSTFFLLLLLSMLIAMHLFEIRIF